MHLRRPIRQSNDQTQYYSYNHIETNLGNSTKGFASKTV